MFKGFKLMFKTLKLLYKALGQVFQALEHKIYNGVNNSSTPSRLSFKEGQKKLTQTFSYLCEFCIYTLDSSHESITCCI